jgi:thiamine kinase-like enzyme
MRWPLWQEPRGIIQPLHGDAHPGNLIATHDGLMWIDFEDVCRGPLEWDLASMMDPAAALLHHRPDPELLQHCMELRRLHVVLALITFYEDFGDQEGWDESIRNMLGQLASVP